MKRLVYSPKISAYIKADSGVYDISEYIVDFSIDRKINQVSTAELSIRNPNKRWTNHAYKDNITGEMKEGPVFHPMDPITIFLTRLQGKPVQVFTGFCDETPYLQLFPGTVPIKASCTLKKLQYTYFDAGLPFMREFLEQAGWLPNEDGSIVKPSAEQANNEKGKAASESIGGIRYGDSGIGELLFKVLNEIGNWPEETIYIQNMPPSVIELVANLFELFKSEDEEASEELTELLKKIVGTSASGTGSLGGEGTSPTDEATGTGTGSKNTLQLAKEAYNVKGTTTWTSSSGTVTIAKWIYPALLWAKENGANTEVTSGYRPGADPNTSTGVSEHQGDYYKNEGPKGAIDFGGFTEITGKEHREEFLHCLGNGYPGPMLIKATGFEDYGHCSATGH